jgi:ABC-type transport system involved in cytochrome bd biosynthesis fused ATPase/permease subunit
VGSWNGKKSAVALGDSHVNKSTVKATKPINPATNSVDSSESGNMESAWNLCHPVDESVKGDFKIKIPYKISVTTGERLIVLGRSNSGKSSFFQSILGNVIREYGNLEVGGKISYVPQIPFLLRETIKNNIIFGGIDVKEKLDMVEEFVELTHELNKLEKYDSAILEDINAVLSPVMRQKISLARALYNDPDVFLIDDIFTEMDINSVKKLLNNFEKILPQKTLIISTVLTSIIRPNDLVLIFDQGTALEQGVFVNMVGNPSSYIHNFMRYESAVLEKMNIMSKQLTARCSIQ